MAMILTPRPRPYTSNETLHEHYSYVGKLEGRLKDAPEGSTLTTVLFLRHSDETAITDLEPLSD